MKKMYCVSLEYKAFPVGMFYVASETQLNVILGMIHTMYLKVHGGDLKYEVKEEKLLSSTYDSIKALDQTMKVIRNLEAQFQNGELEITTT